MGHVGCRHAPKMRHIGQIVGICSPVPNRWDARRKHTAISKIAESFKIITNVVPEPLIMTFGK